MVDFAREFNSETFPTMYAIGRLYMMRMWPETCNRKSGMSDAALWSRL